MIDYFDPIQTPEHGTSSCCLTCTRDPCSDRLSAIKVSLNEINHFDLMKAYNVLGINNEDEAMMEFENIMTIILEIEIERYRNKPPQP